MVKKKKTKPIFNIKEGEQFTVPKVAVERHLAFTGTPQQLDRLARSSSVLVPNLIDKDTTSGAVDDETSEGDK